MGSARFLLHPLLMAHDESSLVPVAANSLGLLSPAGAPVITSMVEQCLAIAKPELMASTGPRILLGDWDEEFVALWKEEIRQHCKGGCDVSFTSRGDVAGLMDAAAKERFDLAVITLNNVFGIGPSVSERVRGMLQVIRHLKTTYGMHIIAITGHYDSDDLPERAREAGADVFRDRSDIADLAALVQLYLNRAHSHSSWNKWVSH